MRIGWLGTSIPLDNVAISAQFAGSSLRLAGKLHGAEAPTGYRAYAEQELQILRAQIVGLENNVDDLLVACVFGGVDDDGLSIATSWGDATLNGIYRVVRSSVSYDAGSLCRAGLPFQIELERIATRPKMESAVVCVPALGAPAPVTQWNPVWGLPDNATEMNYGIYDRFQPLVSSSGKKLWRLRMFYPASQGYFPSTWSADCDEWNTGGCYIGRITDRGTVNERVHPIHGRVVDSIGADWEIGNGLIRIRPRSTGELEVQWRHSAGASWTPTSWLLTLGGTAYGSMSSIRGVEVRRNSLSEITIALSDHTPVGSIDDPEYTVSITIRRALHSAKFGITSAVADNHFCRTNVASVTGATGELTTLAGLIPNVRVVTFTHQPSTFNTGGWVTTSSAVQQAVFTVGGLVTPTAVADPHPLIAELRHEAWSWLAERSQVIAR